MIRQAQAEDFDAVRKIFREYANSLPPGHICIASFEEELSRLPESYPVVLLDFEEGELAGCIALRHLNRTACEMKRLYVRNAWRGAGLGRRLVEELLQVARGRNYQVLRLDTAPDFTAACALYRRMGFQPIPPYKGQDAELLCMELVL